MSENNRADIVFCLDSSGSMQHAIDEVKNNITQLLLGLKNDTSSHWDVRVDICAFHDSPEQVHYYKSIRNRGAQLIQSIYFTDNKDSFFTNDIYEFQQALADIEVEGEEMHLLALDIAMDYPWRASSDCHRIVILISDEAVETGVDAEQQCRAIPQLIKKAMAKRIKLFIVAPESSAFYELSALDRCEYKDLDNVERGLRNIDFATVLSTIGKSVSVSQSYDGGMTEPSPTYGQKDWVVCDDVDWGEDN